MTRSMMKQRAFGYFVAAFFVLVFAARTEAIVLVTPPGIEDAEGDDVDDPSNPYPDE